MSIAARVVADSISPKGKRITTFVLTYPRFIHAEFMTHRVFSRNAASSRAIPAKKIRKAVREDPALPIYWGKNQPGMSADEELGGWQLKLVKFLLFTVAMRFMLAINWMCEKLGLHKQIANRYLEPWFNITVVVTSTEWANFYHLRNHKKAQPEIRELAQSMLEAQNQSIPRMLQYGQWHLPFVEDSELVEMELKEALQVSVARCARVSYLNHEGKRSTFQEDLRLFNRLLVEEPIHASPAEHQATPNEWPGEPCGNFFGWIQHRKMFANENLVEYKGLTIP
jgi:hypothetical protein